MPRYRILPGHSFVDSDGSVKGGGQSIELGDDIAAQHPDKLQLQPEPDPEPEPDPAPPET